MRIKQDATFRRERERYALRFCCESCAFFSPADEACALGFPNEEHREGHYRSPTVEVVFCKDYELA